MIGFYLGFAMPAFVLIFLPSAIAAKLLKPELALAVYVVVCIAVVIDLSVNIENISYPNLFIAGLTAVPAATYVVKALTGIYMLAQCFKTESEF